MMVTGRQDLGSGQLRMIVLLHLLPHLVSLLDHRQLGVRVRDREVGVRGVLRAVQLK